MIKRFLAATVIAALAFPGALAEKGVYSAVTPEGRTVTLTVINDHVIKVENNLQGEASPVSRATVLAPDQEFKGSANKVGNVTSVTTPGGITATVNSATGEVTLTAGAGRTVTDPGVRQLKDGKRSLSLYTTGTGNFYGAGERGHSYNLKGDTLVMYNKQNYGYTRGEKRISQMNITMPLYLSSDGYALVFDDFAAAEMILSNPIQYITESPSPVSYYFVAGEKATLASTVEQLSALTGRQDLPPLWSLGYITSKYGYHTQAETTGVIDTLKRRDYPVDGVVLDLYWYGKEQDMGRLAWDKDQWPDHQKMLADLKKKGVNMVIISQPYILQNGRGVDNYNLLAEKGLMLKNAEGDVQPVTIWVGEGGMFDVSNPATRQWLADRYAQLTDEGVTGWWGDLGEPEVHPEDGVHFNGLTTRQYHNQYGNDWSEIIYDLFQEKYPDTRLMTMMRGGTTGLQRYSVFPWSTDVSRSWGGLQPQVTIMLNSGLSGLGYMSHDVGGFAIDKENPRDPELYIRWLQLGLFSPVLRTHAQFDAEPYKYPAEESIAKALIKERYRWLPYNYTLAYENATKGYPMVRPLSFTQAGQTAYDEIWDQYLWGDNVLVAPVLEQGATSRQVVIPAGEWLYLTKEDGRVYTEGDTVTVDAPLEVLPLFVRKGAFLPMADYKMQNTGDYNPGVLTLNYYPSTEASTGYVYEDNAQSTKSLTANEYAILGFEVQQTADGEITVKVTLDGSYPGMPAKRKISLVIHNVDKAPATAEVDGKRVKAAYNAASRTVTIPLTGPCTVTLK